MLSYNKAFFISQAGLLDIARQITLSQQTTDGVYNYQGVMLLPTRVGVGCHGICGLHNVNNPFESLNIRSRMFTDFDLKMIKTGFPILN